MVTFVESMTSFGLMFEPCWAPRHYRDCFPGGSAPVGVSLGVSRFNSDRKVLHLLSSFRVKIASSGHRVVVSPIAAQCIRRSSNAISFRLQRAMITSVIVDATYMGDRFARATSEHPDTFLSARWPFMRWDTTLSRVNNTSPESTPWIAENSETHSSIDSVSIIRYQYQQSSYHVHRSLR